MTEFLRDRSLVPQRALFDAGFELAGVRFQQFAERLLAAAAASPRAPIQDLTRSALESVDGGGLALIAEEPALAECRLGVPVISVAEQPRGPSRWSPGSSSTSSYGAIRTDQVRPWSVEIFTSFVCSAA